MDKAIQFFGLDTTGVSDAGTVGKFQGYTDQGFEIRPGRIKSYRIRSRILYDQYEYE